MSTLSNTPHTCSFPGAPEGCNASQHSPSELPYCLLCTMTPSFRLTAGGGNVWRVPPTSAHRTLAQDSATKQLSATVSRSAASPLTAGLEVWPRNRVSSGAAKVACRAVAGPLSQVSHAHAELMLMALRGADLGCIACCLPTKAMLPTDGSHRWL